MMTTANHPFIEGVLHCKINFLLDENIEEEFLKGFMFDLVIANVVEQKEKFIRRIKSFR
jgi:hypothetical protein